MRIAVVTPGFSASEDDWCIPAVLDFVRRLSAVEDVHVFALRYPFARGRYRVFDAEVHASGGGHRGRVATMAMLARTARAIAAEHRRAPFAVLHALWADESGWLAARLGALLRVPVVTSLMGGEVARFPELGYGTQLGRPGRRRVARAIDGARRWTAGSAAILAYARGVLPGRHPPVDVVPFGTEPERFSPEGERRAPEDGRRAILHVGSLTPVKDQVTLLRAFARVAVDRPDVELWLVGDGPLRDDLAELARSLGLGEHVRFYGARPHGELPAWYRGAAVCAFSSRYESQALVVLEAASCARAVVGTRVGVLPELGDAARAVPVADPDALAAALGAVLDDEAERNRMGEAGRRRVLARFTAERTVETFRGIYREVAAAGGSTDSATSPRSASALR